MEKKVCAVIVSYNPEENIFNNTKNLIGLVDQVIIVDNGSTNEASLNYLSKLNRLYDNCKIIYNKENKGIAYALNVGCKIAAENDYEWVLTLDDDSSVPEGMVTNLLKEYYEKKDNKIMILAPIITEFNSENYMEHSKYVDTVITSGSLINIKSFENVGWFKENFFIDMVDIEYCLRLKKHGFKVFQSANAILYHRLGRQKNVLSIGKFKWNAYNHNEIRKYYICRNTVQLYKEYFAEFPIKLFLSTKGAFKIFLLDTLIVEKNKTIKLKMMLKGIKDGFFNRMGKLDEKEILR